MHVEKRLEDLIEAGWHVVDSEYDADALYFWKKKAADFFSDFLGPEHMFTKEFRKSVDQFERSVRAGK